METRDDEPHGPLHDDGMPGEMRLVAATIARAIADATHGNVGARLWIESTAVLPWLAWLLPPDVDLAEAHARLLAYSWDNVLKIVGGGWYQQAGRW